MTARARKTSRAAFGSVRRLPSGRYQARYTDRYDQRHTAPQTFATKGQATDWLATVRADMVRGTWRPPVTATTLDEWASAYLATRLDLAPRTRDLYADVLERWISAPLTLPPRSDLASNPPAPAATITLGHSDLSDITVADVRQWYAAARHTARTRAEQRALSAQRRQRAAAVHHARAWARTQGLAVKDTGRLPSAVLKAWTAAGSPAARAAALTPDGQPAHHGPASVPSDAGRAQVAQAYRLLHMLLNQAMAEGRIDANPCQIPGAGHTPSTHRIPATPQQIADLAAAMPPRYAAAVHVAAWSGLRAGELFALSRRHLDLDAGTVRVERAVTYSPDKPPTIGATKTENSRRTVHLPAHVIALLVQHLEQYARTGPDALVFPAPDGGLAPREVRKQAFWRARAAIGRPDLRWHDLRHTGATLAAQAGASLAELQHRLGHTTVQAAMIYQHHSHDRDRDLAARLDLLRSTTTTTTEPAAQTTDPHSATTRTVQA